MTGELLKVLDELVAILELHGERHWSQWIRDDASIIREGDLYGVRHFLTAYGGMGSLNDMWLCASNGHKITEEETKSENERLSKMRSEAWDLAQLILRSE